MAVVAVEMTGFGGFWRGRTRRLLFVTGKGGGCIVIVASMAAASSMVQKVASYIWRYNCVDNSNVSTLEPDLEREFYRHVAESEPLLLDISAGHQRAAACLGCIIYYYKVLVVEETACAIMPLSITRWLDLIRLKWDDPQQLDFRQVTLKDVRFYEALFLLHRFYGSPGSLSLLPANDDDGV